jgi:predicted amidophosphoribosyltransferase
MGLVIFLLLTVIVAGILAHPLLPGRMPAQSTVPVTDGDIDRAVRHFRHARSQSGLSCPACGKGYQAGDRFCVRCGAKLPEGPAAASTDPLCPACGAAIHKGDQFCAKCGHSMDAGGAA